MKQNSFRLGQDSLLELTLENEIEWVTVRSLPLGSAYRWYTAVKNHLASIGLPPFIRSWWEEIEIEGNIISQSTAVMGFEVDVPASEVDGLLLIASGVVVYEKDY